MKQFYFPLFAALLFGGCQQLEELDESMTSKRAVNETLQFQQAYYVDDVNGNDNNPGTSPSQAWKTLTKVNNTTFQPGDAILFKAGGIWVGQLHPKGEGTAGSPILIDQYDSGNKPFIDGNGMTGAPVRLFNQSYWEIGNLEISNDATAEGDRRGLEVLASNYGTANHIHLKNLVIHDVKGIVGGTSAAKRTAGIYIATVDDSGTDTRFNDILIEDCELYNISNQGIVTNNEVKANDYPGTAGWHKRKFTNVSIRNNTIHHITKNAMIVRLTEGGVVEYNVCYHTATETTGNTMFSRSALGTVFQYNEGYLNQSPGVDGSMYDADLGSPECVFQYSYSHDNAHGLMWYATYPQDEDIIVRYNISQDDKGFLVAVRSDMESTYIYNNVFYIPSDLSPTIIQERDRDNTYYYYNNIVYNNSTSASYDFQPTPTRIIEHNIFYGQHPSGEPADPWKITTDPLFVNPGSGGVGVGSVNGYQLQAGSPAISSGRLIADNGGQDYWENPVSATYPPNRGADNGNAVPALILQPSHDAFVRGGVYASNNYGTSSDLEVKQGTDPDFFRKTYIKFDFTGSGVSSVQSAKLRLFCHARDGNITVTAYETHNDWGENGITWANAPVTGSSISSTVVNGTGAFHDWDVTSYVNQRLSAGAVRISFVLYDAGASNVRARFNSKEAGANRPALIMEL